MYEQKKFSRCGLPEEAGNMVLCACGSSSCSPSQGVRGGQRSPGGQGRGGPQGQVTAVATHLFPVTSMLCIDTHRSSSIPCIDTHRNRCQILRENLDVRYGDKATNITPSRNRAADKDRATSFNSSIKWQKNLASRPHTWDS